MSPELIQLILYAGALLIVVYYFAQRKKKSSQTAAAQTPSSPQPSGLPNQNGQYVGKYRAMEDSELICAAQSGDISAACEYANRLFRQKLYTDAQMWYLRGAQAGNPFCTEMYARVTLIDVHISLKSGSKPAVDCLNDLREAEKWSMRAFNGGNQRGKDVLSGNGGVYDLMAWCHFVAALQTNEYRHYDPVISCYEKITAVPSSRSTLAYIRALTKKDAHRRAMRLAAKLAEHFDETLDDSCQFMLYSMLTQAYFEGKYIPANFEKSYFYLRKLKEVCSCPEDEESIEQLWYYYSSGQAKADFNSARAQDVLSAVIQGLRH